MDMRLHEAGGHERAGEIHLAAFGLQAGSEVGDPPALDADVDEAVGLPRPRHPRVSQDQIHGRPPLSAAAVHTPRYACSTAGSVRSLSAAPSCTIRPPSIT